MNLTAMPGIGPTALRPLACHRRAGLLGRWIERGHVFDMPACVDGWQRADAPATGPFPSPGAPRPDSEDNAS